MKGKLRWCGALLLSACGGGGGTVLPAIPDPAGLYAGGPAGGYFSSPGAVRDDLIVMIDSKGDGAMLLVPNGSSALVASSVFRFKAPRERSFMRTFREYARPGTAFSPGVTARNGTLDADLSLDELTLDGTLDTAAFVVDYVKLYETPVPFSVSQGSYVYSIPTAGTAESVTFTLSAVGEISGSSAGCTYAGNMTIPDARFNVYNLSMTRQCPPAAAVAYTGLAFFSPAVPGTPAFLVFAYDDGGSFGLGTAAERQ